MTRVVGADVAKGSWVFVILEDGKFAGAGVVAHLIQLRQRTGPVEMLALDIPIGLPEAGVDWPRAADLEARDFIGPRRSSVFAAPPRRVLNPTVYSKANQLHQDLTGKGLSRQTWGLRDRILEAAFYVSENPTTVEVHPEVCFRAMKGSPLAQAKKSWNGQMERRALLHSHGIDLPDHLEDAGLVPPDDLLDAAAAAWTARRIATGDANVLPGSAAGCSATRRGVIWY